MKRLFKIWCNFSLVAFFLISCSFSQNLKKKLTPEEYLHLSRVFEHLMTEDVLGYVIYGNKPVYSVVFHDIDYYDPDFQKDEDLLFFIQNVDLFKKLNGEGRNFKINYEQIDGAHYFSVINKKALKKVIHSNLAFFQNKLNHPKTASEIYSDIIKGETSAYEGQAIIGTLLGYGARNSQIYEDGINLLNEIESRLDLEYIDKLEDYELAQKLFDHAKEKYLAQNYENWKNHIEDLESYGNEPVEGILINFAYDAKSKESKEIIQDYKKAQKRINKILKNKNFLNKVLRKMCS